MKIVHAGKAELQTHTKKRIKKTHIHLPSLKSSPENWTEYDLEDLYQNQGQ